MRQPEHAVSPRLEAIDIEAGDPVTIVANPMKDGTSAGLMYTVTLADGRVLGPGALSVGTASRPCRRARDGEARRC